MTWIELLYWTVLTPIVVLLMITILSFTSDFDLMGIFFFTYLLVSFIAAFTPFTKDSEIKTSTIEPQIVYEKIVDDKLTIITLSGNKLTFDKYSDIQAWERGDKLVYNTYFTKKGFGFDSNRREYIFVSENDLLKKNHFKIVE
jgi:hypothetical protein